MLSGWSEVYGCVCVNELQRSAVQLCASNTQNGSIGQKVLDGGRAEMSVCAERCGALFMIALWPNGGCRDGEEAGEKKPVQ